MKTVTRGRLVGWVALVTVLALLAYAARAAGGRPDRDVLYRYSTAVGGLVEYAILAGVLALLLRGLDARSVLALRRPASWPRALGIVAGALVAIVAVGAALSPFLDAGKDQGLVPDRWEPAHAGAYAANFVVVSLVAPLVEESTFRGLGFAAVGTFYGTVAAVVGTAFAFGLAHGLESGLPVLVAFGLILGVVRARTNSLFPGMLVHGLFNAASLIIAVTVGAST